MKRILNQDAELTIRDKIANWIFFFANIFLLLRELKKLLNKVAITATKKA
jgi:hypothetical protein